MESNVVLALAKVQAEIGGIGKSKPKDAALNYAYRGIDAICAAAQPLLGTEGVVIVPTEATITSIVEITVNGKPWTDTFVSVEWTIYGPGGLQDALKSVTQGIGRDNSDKGINKAMTGAFKNLVLRILCIGDPKDDADQPDHQHNETDAGRPQADPKRQPLQMPVAELVAAINAEDLAELVAEKINAEATKYNQLLSAAAFEADHEWANYIASLLKAP